MLFYIVIWYTVIKISIEATLKEATYFIVNTF